MMATANTAAGANKRLFHLAVGLAAFFSPTLYFFLVLFADRFHVTAPPEVVVASLFFGIPLVALVVCEWLVWSSGTTVACKVSLMLLTLVGMFFQFGILLVIVITAITAAIAYPQ